MLISVIIPTFNRASVLSKTIHLVLSQTYKNLEIIVVDDASNDDTKFVVKNFINNNVYYVGHSQQQGTTKSRLSGIKASKGQLIAFLDDDDVWEKTLLEKHLSLFLKQPALDFVMCNYIVHDCINDGSYSVSLSKFAKNFPSSIVLGPGPFFQCCLFKKAFIMNSLDAFNALSEPSEDWDFFLSVAHKNPIVAHIDESLFHWNFSHESQSANFKKEWLAIEYIITKNKNVFLAFGSKNNLSLQFRRLGYYMYVLKKPGQSKHYYNLAYSTFPWSIANVCYKLLFLMPNNVIKYFMKTKNI